MDASSLAVQFGAGNIGRGFLGQLFRESGFDVAFVDVSDAVVEALNARRGYTIHIVGRDTQDVRIDRIRAIHGNDVDSVREALATCAIAATAVGAGALGHIAPNLAVGLIERDKRGAAPLNVLVCENLHDASDRLRDLVAERIPPDRREGILANTGFVQAVVSRMVPIQEPAPDDPLAIRVEAYRRLPVDGQAVRGALPPIAGIEPVRNFQAHVERKLYAHNCAHAALGYLGYAKGIEFAWQALQEPGIREVTQATLAETGEALIRRHKFDRSEHARHVADLLDRFGNRDLGDTCFRLARDPIRKLAPDDRLVGAARLCEAEGITPIALVDVIAAALRFDGPEDPSAQELQKRLRIDGLPKVLEFISGLLPGEPLTDAVSRAYRLRAGG